MGLQDRFGSRFFIPSYFLPEKYNYYVSMKTASPEDEVVIQFFDIIKLIFL